MCKLNNEETATKYRNEPIFRFEFSNWQTQWLWNHSHKKRKIVWKQTKRYCFNSFNPNFLEPRPKNLHKNCKQTEAKLIRYYFLERRYSASFICQKCLAKTVQYQVAVFQEKIKELAFSKFHFQIRNLTRSRVKVLSTLFWNTDNVINL